MTDLTNIKPVDLDYIPEKIPFQNKLIGEPNMTATIISLVVKPLLALLDPLLKTELSTFLQSLYSKALGTSSPIDDIAIKFVCDILGIDLSNVTAAPKVAPSGGTQVIK